jgi:FkbM family methyltransferase
MFDLLKYRLAKKLELHPCSWFIGWFLVNRLTFLLPHDKSYFALRHFSNKSHNDLFVDVGANSGISALSFRKLNKQTPILSIEPNPLHANRLKRLSKKLRPFEFLLKGVGDEETEITFYTPIYKHIVLHTFSSSSEEQVYEAVGKSYGPEIAKNLKINQSSAHIVTLDQLNLKPSIIKIDAEGFDYKVLLGARKTIETERPFLMVEACHVNIAPFDLFFKNIGYERLNYHYDVDAFSSFQKESLSQMSGGRNIFAVPSEKMKLLPIRAEVL